MPLEQQTVLEENIDTYQVWDVTDREQPSGYVAVSQNVKEMETCIAGIAAQR